MPDRHVVARDALAQRVEERLRQDWPGDPTDCFFEQVARSAADAMLSEQSIGPLTRHDLRELAYRELARKSTEPKVRTAVDSLGFFTVVDLLDALVDAVVAAIEAGGRYDAAE